MFTERAPAAAERRKTNAIGPTDDGRQRETASARRAVDETAERSRGGQGMRDNLFLILLGSNWQLPFVFDGMWHMTVRLPDRLHDR